MKRTFIATKITPGDKLLNAYRYIQDELENEKIKWVDSQQFHITLFFLGDTDEEQIPYIRNSLREVLTPFSAFNMHLSGLGLFKNIHKPRVLWTGIHQFERMKEIKTQIDRQMKALGFTPEKREFKPHLTLGRIKWINNKKKLENLLDQYKDEDFHEVTINEIIYFESILKPQGPVYKAIEKYTLLDSGQ